MATTSDNLAAWIRCIDISSSTPSQFLLYAARCGCDLQMVPRLFLGVSFSNRVIGSDAVCMEASRLSSELFAS